MGERETELQRTSLRHNQLINGRHDYAIHWFDPIGRVTIYLSGIARVVSDFGG